MIFCILNELLSNCSFISLTWITSCIYIKLHFTYYILHLSYILFHQLDQVCSGPGPVQIMFVSFPCYASLSCNSKYTILTQEFFFAHCKNIRQFASEELYCTQPKINLSSEHLMYASVCVYQDSKQGNEKVNACAHVLSCWTVANRFCKGSRSGLLCTLFA